MAKKTDEKTLELIKLVSQQKADIAKIEKPDWKTNASFSFTEGSSQVINIKVVSNIKELILIGAFLLERQKFYQESAVALEVEGSPNFIWCGFSVSDWFYDIKARIAKIQISLKKQKLEALESRLNSIISPELRAEMELEAISKDLTAG